MEKVSVVILFFHREPKKMPDNCDPYMMQDCVDSIIRSGGKYELIAVDNGSTIDESWIKEYSDQYIRFNKNEGISNGWNAGINSANNDKVIVLGDDTVVAPGWIEAMLKCFEEEDCGVASPHVEGIPYGEGIKSVDRWFPGACFMVSKLRTIDKVGYFDWKTFFPCNWEDADMWVRVMAHGMKLYTNYDVTVQHRMGATLHVDDLSGPFEKLRQRFIKKHGFDVQPYMYGDLDIKDVLDKVDKTKVEINSDIIKMVTKTEGH